MSMHLLFYDKSLLSYVMYVEPRVLKQKEKSFTYNVHSQGHPSLPKLLHIVYIITNYNIELIGRST
mgnify:CR=1 FL=1